MLNIFQKQRKSTKYMRGEKMNFTDREHNYIESEDENDAGHEDTRQSNFECENKSRLGCNLGIDVAG